MTILAFNFLDSSGRWELAYKFLLRGIELARRVVARFSHSLGWLHEQIGDFEKADQYYAESLSNYQAVEDRESEAVVLQRYSGVYRKQKNFEKSQQLIDQARLIAEELNLGDLEALVNTAEGKHHRDLQDWDRSWHYFSLVRDYFEQRTEATPRDDELAMGTWGHLAIVAYHQGRFEQAKDLCLRSIQFFDDSGTKGYLATLKYRLALAEEALGEIEAAEKHVDEALYWFNHLGMKPDIPDALALKKRLEAQ